MLDADDGREVGENSENVPRLRSATWSRSGTRCIRRLNDLLSGSSGQQQPISLKRVCSRCFARDFSRLPRGGTARTRLTRPCRQPGVGHPIRRHQLSGRQLVVSCVCSAAVAPVQPYAAAHIQPLCLPIVSGPLPCVAVLPLRVPVSRPRGDAQYIQNCSPCHACWGTKP